MNRMKMLGLASTLIILGGLCVAFTAYWSSQQKGTETEKGAEKAAEKAAAKPKFTFAVSVYTGWMPWYYAEDTGILQKWADKYNIEIKVERMQYGPSLDFYNAGKAEACLMTNMECLDMPAKSGIDTTVIIVGDYSNGNDAVLVREGTLATLKGQNVEMCAGTVSQYLFSRGLAMKTHLKESDLKIVNVADENDIAPLFLSNKSKACVTWNPHVLDIRKKAPAAKKLFDSSEIPGEIQDLLVINTATLKQHPEFARALTGAWYEVMGIMPHGSNNNPALLGFNATTEKALQKMAEESGPECTLGDFLTQLGTTFMFYTPSEAVAFAKSKEIQDKQDLVRKFCFDHQLLGDNAKSADDVGIQYPDGTIQGNPKNVKMRYVSTFMEEAANGQISLKK